jgi:site-specific recombinase XerD
MTIKITIRKDKVNSVGLCPVVIQLSEVKKVARIPLGFSVAPKDFDEKNFTVLKSNTEHKRLNELLAQAQSKISETNRIISSIKSSVFFLEDEMLLFKDFFLTDSNELQDKFNKYIEEHGIKEQVSHVFFSSRDDGNPSFRFQPKVNFQIKIPIGMHDTVRALIKKIIRNEKDPLLDELNSEKEDNRDEYSEDIEKFKGAWQKYLLHCRTTKRRSTASRLDNFYNILVEYTDLNLIPLTFDSLDEDFGVGFKQYLLNEHYNYLTDSKGVSNGTVHNILKSLSAFLNWAFKKGHNKNIEFKKWVTQKPKTDLQYLTEPQLKALQEHKLIPGSSFDKSRDLWLFSAYSGMRISDIQRWMPSFVTTEGTIKYKSQKSRKNCTVGLNKVTQSILNKYNNQLPKQNSVLINKNIKKILAQMGYDKILVNRVIAKGNDDIVRTLSLAEAITVHSAKRSFINLMISKKVQVAHLSTMIGNEIKTLMVYYKDDTSQMRKVMNELDL